jgi:diacylglycerol kinase (ATP)
MSFIIWLKYTKTTMSRYTAITIIYNPNSTGSSRDLALELEEKLHELMPGQKVQHVPTERAGHGEQLAYQAAKATKRPLIISSSGDGGYHDVINGLLRAKREGANPVAGLLPAGNANDHYRHLHETDTAEAIAKGEERVVDLLKLRTTSRGKSLVRFAHSYIGLGFTPQAGSELNKTKLNRFNEIAIVVKVFINLKPVRLRVGGKTHHYDSLIFSNIDKMSKIMTVAPDARADDGTFVIAAFHRRNKLKLVQSILKASTTGLDGGKRARQFTFHTHRRTLVQLDGEIQTIDARAKATVSLELGALRCII